MMRAFGSVRLPSLRTAAPVLAAVVFVAWVLRTAVDMPPRFAVGLVSSAAAILVGMTLPNPRRFFLGLLVLTLPLIVINYIGTPREHLGGPEGFYNTIYDLPLLALLFLWVVEISRTGRRTVRFSRPDFCLLGILALSIASVFVALDPLLSVYELARFLPLVFMFLYVERHVRTDADIRVIVVALLAGLCIQVMIGIAQASTGETLGLALFGESLSSFAGLPRIGGTLRHPNGFASYLGMLVPLAGALVVAPIALRYRIGCALLTALGLCCLILTQSRGGWVSGLLSLAVFFPLCVKSGLMSIARAARVAVGFLIAASVLALLFQDLVTTRLLVDDYGAAYSRLPSMAIALEIIRSHPVLGVGLNNYWPASQPFGASVPLATHVLEHVVHNSYLLTAAQIGVGGLALLLTLMASVARTSYRALSRSTPLRCAVSVGVLTGIAAYAVHIFIEPVPLTGPTFAIFWLLAAFLLAIARDGRLGRSVAPVS